MAKANKKPPVPFNCTFYVTATHFFNFVLNIPVTGFSLLSVRLQMHTSCRGWHPRKQTYKYSDFWFLYQKLCSKISIFFNYTAAYLEGQFETALKRKDFLVPCILIIPTEFTSKMHLLQTIPANSPEYDPKALLISKELQNHINNIFLSLKCWKAQA